jgi:hypothetical protein
MDAAICNDCYRVLRASETAHVLIPYIYHSNRVNQLAVSSCSHRIAAA